MDCLCISGEEFDRNNGLLNCINGTLELSSLTFRKHRADDLITKMCNVVYDSTAASEMWDSYLPNTSTAQFPEWFHARALELLLQC